MGSTKIEPGGVLDNSYIISETFGAAINNTGSINNHDRINNAGVITNSAGGTINNTGTITNECYYGQRGNNYTQLTGNVTNKVGSTYEGNPPIQTSCSNTTNTTSSTTIATSSAITMFGVAPSLQITNHDYVVAAGDSLMIRFNVTTYQPGTLYWSIANGSGQTTFASWFEIRSGQVTLPEGVTAAYPSGISSSENKSNVVAILTFASVTAGKTFPLTLVVWLVPKSDPTHPLAVAEQLVVTVGIASQRSSFPLELVFSAGVVSLVCVLAFGLLFNRRKHAGPQPIV